VKKIIFFDGVCVMCNALVDFALKHDHQQIFHFAPLQGETAQARIPQFSSDLNTVVLLDESGISTESDAIIKLLQGLGGPLRLAVIFKLVPKFLRDRMYRYVAKNRYRWFGAHESCRLPTKEERHRLLD
jgi:predicted DCC family thiol-disulfide oxidoreductase YuxK